jgi:hypothetical protein
VLRSICALTLAFVPFSAATSAVTVAPCPDIYTDHPVVIFTVTPPNLSGIVQDTLTLYNTGMCTYSRSKTGGIDSKSALAFASPLEVDQLFSDLSGLGAGTLCDDGLIALGAPFQTLTMLRGGTDSHTHTFSWRLGLGAYGQVANRMDQFITATFPGF